MIEPLENRTLMSFSPFAMENHSLKGSESIDHHAPAKPSKPVPIVSPTAPVTATPPIPGDWTQIFSSTHANWSTEQWGVNYTGTATANADGSLTLAATSANTPALLETENAAKPFSFRYGLVSVVAKVPAGNGIWPAIWMLPLESQSPDDSAGEIDIFEGQGSTPTIDYATYHWGEKGQQIGVNDNAAVNLSAGYHTYSVDWEKNSITWYLDGKVIQIVTSKQASIDSDDMYLILDVWTGGWTKPVDSSTPFPATMIIQSVNVWQE